MSNEQPLKLAVAGSKSSAESLMERLNDLGASLREVIVEAKRLPPTQGLAPHQDPTRSIAVAQSYLQTGFMWLRRAIAPTKDF